jgi:hypothetical protein
MQVDVEEVLVRSVNGFVNAKNPWSSECLHAMRNSQHIIYTTAQRESWARCASRRALARSRDSGTREAAWRHGSRARACIRLTLPRTQRPSADGEVRQLVRSWPPIPRPRMPGCLGVYMPPTPACLGAWAPAPRTRAPGEARPGRLLRLRPCCRPCCGHARAALVSSRRSLSSQRSLGSRPVLTCRPAPAGPHLPARTCRSALTRRRGPAPAASA